MSSYRPEIPGKSVSAMSTAALEALLQAGMDPETDMDADLIRAAAAELEERTPVEVDVNAAWESFIHNHLPYEPLHQDIPEAEASISKQTPSKSSRRRLLRMGLIAAALVILLVTAVSANRFALWNVIYRWTDQTLNLRYGESGPAEANPELAELRDALAADGVQEALVPRYLPEGYRQTEFYADGKQYAAVFEREDQALTIQIRQVPRNSGRQFEADPGSSEIYDAGGVRHTLFTNMGAWEAVWVDGAYECSITHAPSREELIRMIDSIYTGG